MELRFKVPASERTRLAPSELDSLPEGFRLEEQPDPARSSAASEMVLLALSFPVSVTASVAATLICNYLERRRAGPILLDGVPIDPNRFEESVLLLAEHIEKKRKRLNLDSADSTGTS